MLKYLVGVAIVVAVAVPIVLVFSFGGSGLPDAPACPAPSPVVVASVVTTPDEPAAAERAGQDALNTNIQALSDLRDAFRKQYPTDTFFRDKAFRPDFATYADKSICLAEQMVETSSVMVGGDEIPLDKPRLDSALRNFIGTMQDGRDAVARRNVTNYQNWYATIGSKLQAIRDAATNPAGP